ncbi:hypothetical protein P4S95_09305 [Aneurinibacillus aneurinilyticus]|uniref:hypothetical protein n=1 Tax=Aneurinibacillus aneurinilyticus TaxID=1391 RepID=UPI002E213C1D|nr:hypothetical protein [Aneurinibacillus aneurinilyticus]
MDFLTYETLTKGMCPCCRSRFFNRLPEEEREVVIDTAMEIDSFMPHVYGDFIELEEIPDGKETSEATA